MSTEKRTGDSADTIIESWLSDIRGLYGDQRAEDYRKEEQLLKVYLRKLLAETEDSKRLQMCKLKAPFTRRGPALSSKPRMQVCLLKS